MKMGKEGQGVGENSPYILHASTLLPLLFSALKTSPDEGLAGTMLFYHPSRNDFDRQRYLGRDVEFYTRCCTDIDLCDMFFERRIINDCQEYAPPAIGIYTEAD